MSAPRNRVVVNALPALGGILVVALHLYVGISAGGRSLLRPVGEMTIFVLLSWIVNLGLCAPALVLAHGRSRTAIGALAITLVSAALVFSV